MGSVRRIDFQRCTRPVESFTLDAIPQNPTGRVRDHVANAWMVDGGDDGPISGHALDQLSKCLFDVIEVSIDVRVIELDGRNHAVYARRSGEISGSCRRTRCRTRHPRRRNGRPGLRENYPRNRGSTPPTSSDGSHPVPCSSAATRLVVVVLPWVPETTTGCFPRSRAGRGRRETTDTASPRRSRPAPRGSIGPHRISDHDQIWRCGSSTCSGRNPECTGMPQLFEHRAHWRVEGVVRTGDPDPAGVRASPASDPIPVPPIATK